MPNAPKKIPLRKCVGCEAMKPKKELMRIVRASDGAVSVDKTGKKSGRGAYICPDSACLAKAKKQKRLERAFECPVGAEIYERLAGELADEG